MLLVVCGPVLGPLWYVALCSCVRLNEDVHCRVFSTGYLIQNKGWHGAFYLTAAIYLGLFFAQLLFGPETLYTNRVPAGEEGSEKCVMRTTDWRDQYLVFRIRNPKPITWQEVLRPFTMATRPIVVLSAFGLALPFTYTGVIMVRIAGIVGNIY